MEDPAAEAREPPQLARLEVAHWHPQPLLGAVAPHLQRHGPVDEAVEHAVEQEQVVADLLAVGRRDDVARLEAPGGGPLLSSRRHGAIGDGRLQRDDLDDLRRASVRGRRGR